jgi:hypothetical protein
MSRRSVQLLPVCAETKTGDCENFGTKRTFTVGLMMGDVATTFAMGVGVCGYPKGGPIPQLCSVAYETCPKFLDTVGMTLGYVGILELLLTLVLIPVLMKCHYITTKGSFNEHFVMELMGQS